MKTHYAKIKSIMAKLDNMLQEKEKASKKNKEKK